MRLAGYLAIGLLAGLLIAMVAIVFVTRTEWGMERARRIAVGWLEERVQGELRLGRITGPGLLGGVMIHDFGIVDPLGRPFLSADSLELAYEWRTLLAGRIVLNRIALYQPRVALERLPGETEWNYERVFPPGPEGEPDQRTLIMFSDARIVDGNVAIRMPFEPDGPVLPEDTARIVIEEVPGGLVRTMSFHDVNARLNRVIWESPIEKGRLFDVQSLQARGYIWRDPFLIRNARGTVTTRDSVIAFDMPEVRLPSSEAGILGRIVIRTGPNDIDVAVDGRRLVFRDLDWLYPNLPAEGGGTLTLRIQSQPDGILWLAEDARLTAPGTRVAGTFGVVTGDTLYFTQVDLRASPLDIQLIEDILPGALPVEGLLVGTVEVRGPISALRTTGDMQLTGDVRGTGSRLAWRGVLDLRNGQVAARSMHADVSNLELALLTAFSPDLHLVGSVSGSVDGSGRMDRLLFTAALDHASADGARSRLDGGGTVTGSGRNRLFDLTVNAIPVSMQDLAAQVPALEGLQGELRGPVHLSGTADDFVFDAGLATEGGDLELSGRVLRAGATQRVIARGTASQFRLHALRPELPETVVTARIDLDVTGDDLATAVGTVYIELDSARHRGMPIGRIRLGGSLADGVLLVDSASLFTAAGIGRASGTVALVASRSGRLEAGFVSESLTPLESRVFGSVSSGAGAEPRLAGRVDVLATVTGWLGSIDIDARGRGENVVWGDLAAERMAVHVEGQSLGNGESTLVVSASADSLTAWAHSFGTAQLDLLQLPDSLSVTGRTAARGEEKLRGRAVLDDVDGATRIRVNDLRIGGLEPWLLESTATALLRSGTASLDALDLRRASGGRMFAAGTLAWVDLGTLAAGSPVDFGLDLEGVPFTELLAALRSREAGAGTLQGSVRMGGTAAGPVIEAELSGRGLQYGDAPIDYAFVELNYAGLGLDAHAEAQHGGRSILTGGGRIPLDLRFGAVAERRLDLPLRVSISADSLPPALPLGLLDGFSNIRGRIDGTVALEGTTLDPSLSGGFTLRAASADWDVTGLGYRDASGSFLLEGDRLVNVNLVTRAVDPRARAGRGIAAQSGGAGVVSGRLDLTTLSDPIFQLTLTADRTYAAKRRDVEAVVSGTVVLGGRYTRPEISGSLRIDQGTLDIDEIYRQYLVVGLELDDPGLLSIVDTSLVAVRPLLATSQNPFLRNLDVRNLQVAVANESWLRSRDMDVEVTGNLNVTFDRRQEDLRLTGVLNVERGTYTLYYPPLQSRRFQVRQGVVEFPGTPGLDPNLSITAAYRARAQGEPLDVLAVVSGTLQGPRVRLSSDAQPPISESDLASYLFFGVPTWEVASTGGPNAADMRGITGLGVRAIAPSVLGYASSGLQTLVQGAGLLDYVSLTAADATPMPGANAGLTSFLAGTQLELGRYLGSTVFVGYSQRLSNGSYDPAVRLEWRFLPEFSLEMFSEDRFARTPGFGMRFDSGMRKVYGFSLFREWGF
jgi:autotransporter translocation and assembly factor TamB